MSSRTTSEGKTILIHIDGQISASSLCQSRGSSLETGIDYHCIPCIIVSSQTASFLEVFFKISLQLAVQLHSVSFRMLVGLELASLQGSPPRTSRAVLESRNHDGKGKEHKSEAEE